MYRRGCGLYSSRFVQIRVLQGEMQLAIEKGDVMVDCDLCDCPFLPSFPVDVFRFGIVLTLILPLRLKALNLCGEFMKSFAQLDRKIWQKHVECRRPRCC